VFPIISLLANGNQNIHPFVLQISHPLKNKLNNRRQDNLQADQRPVKIPDRYQ
jgi:hypothetical protein